MSVKPVRIAMWSGPRNISTAMMRAWENRRDCQVWDEPLYGYYLKSTGIDHPGADEIIADHGSDWRTITRQCIEGNAQNKAIFYQKHMTLHLLDEVDRSWLSSLQNCFLIREPERVIASYATVRSEATLEDIGFIQQAELFDYVANLTGRIPIVIDSKAFLQNPEAMLKLICIKLEIEFDPLMLNWPAGPRASDGIWAKHWYASVCQSTGFAAPREKPLNLSAKDTGIAAKARPYYEHLYQHRLQLSQN
ncbi:MAG: hypothetical protein ACI87H_001223 [Gammaproteobacteria bacterium]|jgi:hypothetical protein